MSHIYIPKVADLFVEVPVQPSRTWATIKEKESGDSFVRISVTFNRSDYRVEDDAADKQANILLAHRIVAALALLEKQEAGKDNA